METITTAKTCTDPVAFDQAMKLIGDFWTLRIIGAVREGELRFCEIERALPDISPATLTNRLKKLEEAEIIDRRVETMDRQSVCYALSGRGVGILPVLDSIREFTDKHFS